MKLPRTLIIDASILFSFFNKDSARRRIIEELPNLGCELISPEFAFKELMSDKEKIMKYGKINELSFSFLFSLLLRKVEPVSKKEYEEFMSEANKLSPHNKQTKDDPYFALALSFNLPIWSDEDEFKQQSKIEIFDTKDFVDTLKSLGYKF